MKSPSNFNNNSSHQSTKSSSCCSKAHNLDSPKIFIEPVIRSFIGALILILVFFYIMGLHSVFLLSILALIGLNLFQSGFTKFCGLEKLFKKTGLSSEMDEIRKLNHSYREAAEAQLTYATTLDLLQKAVIEMSCEYHIIKSTENWEKISGEKVQQMTEDKMFYLTEKKNFMEYVSSEDRGSLRKELDELVRKNGSEILVTRFRIDKFNSDKKENWIEGKFCIIDYDGNRFIRGLLNDITEAHLNELKMHHLALHDPLTNLPNRLFLNEKLKMLQSIADRSNKYIASIFIDLDNFKQINDKYGHPAGDDLLIKVAGILESNIRNHDILIRWGGDEFVIIASDLKSKYDAEIIAEKIKMNFAIEMGDSIYTDVSMSMGIALYPEPVNCIEDLIEKSDSALLKSKADGKNRIIFC